MPTGGGSVDQPPGPTGTSARTAAIAEAAEAFHGAVFDLDVLLHIVAEHISRATGDFCSVALVSPDGRRFQPLVAYHTNPTLVEDSREFLGVSMDIEAAGPWARVLKERRSVVIPIDPDHLPPGMAPHQVLHIRRWRIREAAFIPLVTHDAVVGGLNLNRLEGGPPFTSDDIDLLESLGAQAARAIANARLLQAHKQSAGELEREVQVRTREAEARALEARAAVARLQAALNTPTSAAVIATDPEGVITLFSPGAEQLLGYSADEVVGLVTPAQFMSTAELHAGAGTVGARPAFSVLANRSAASGTAEEWTLTSRTGEERPVELSISPMVDATGNKLGFVVIARDISDRKALEGDLKAALAEGREVVAPRAARREELGELARSLAGWERFSRQRLEGAQAMAELGNLTRVEDVTRVGLERMVAIFTARQGYVALKEADGLHVAAVLNADESPDALRVGAIVDPTSPTARAAATGTAITGMLSAQPGAEAVARLAPSMHGGPVMAVSLVVGGRVAGTVTLIRGQAEEAFTSDEAELATAVSAPLAAAIEVSRLIAELREANSALIDANRHKGQFLASMSHELRTPLNAILGFSELLADDTQGHYDSRTRTRFLNQIHQSGAHLLGLINDILDLSKVDSGQMELKLEPISAADSIAAVVETVEPLARTKNITIDAPPAPDLRLMADGGKLKQMLLNLLSNAIKFTPAGGKVTITARAAESYVEFAVSDTGMGIAKSDLPRLFIEFQQLDPGAGKQQEGTGLGLALTRRLAELHGGDVTVESEQGQGSTFVIRLPIEGKRPAATAPEVPAPALDSDPSRPLVLVVEDNPAAAELLARYLHAGGFRMEIARTGTEALVMAAELKPVAITLDILLPEIDGWEVLTRLKQDERTRDIPTVVVSVVDNPALGRALGAVDYFVKPVDGSALLSRLGQYTFMSKAAQGEIRVLAIDDEPANLDLVEALLEPAGFKVLRAPGGREGIEVARSEKPHLVLLDLLMPEVNGFDVVEALRAQNSTRDIPIMVLTAKKLTDDDKRILNGHVAAVFERRSVAGADLVDWLRRLVTMRKA